MDFLKRYVEQVQTTLETMRRRCIGIYDGVIRLGKYGAYLADRTREMAEPIAYDVKEAVRAIEIKINPGTQGVHQRYTKMKKLLTMINAKVSAALQDMSPLQANEMDTRNSLLEQYLGCSVLSIGLSAGEISGAFLLGAIYERIFDWWWELALVFMLPYYIYLTFRKNGALDEMERRVNLFGLALCIGSFMGHLLGNRLITAMPAVIFIQPLVIGLAVDTELSPPSVYSDRTRLLGFSAGVGVALALLFVMLHGLTLCSVSTILLQAALLVVHFQIVVYCIHNKVYGAGEAQLCYVIATLLLHVIVGGLLGTNTVAGHSESA
ncbi:unnamed protein product [Toxocara canis]|uniref:FUSC family protein n=1 Tax=Toxocara canis TaxID=6265 RepID=A0A183TXY3_TOXCA|nr:unnamed protein product [Toxocara canis]